MAYDSECAKLAEHFLDADAIDRTRESLAQHIHDAVEGWFHEREWEDEGRQREAHDADRRALENREMEDHNRRHPHE